MINKNLHKLGYNNLLKFLNWNNLIIYNNI